MNINNIFIIIIIILLIFNIFKKYDIDDFKNSFFGSKISYDYNIHKIEEPIPKIIYITHKNINDLYKIEKTWKNLNPDYEIKLFDNELCLKFLQENYSDLECDIFNFIPDGPIKADFWRVCILYKRGGVYVDADIEPLVSFKDYVESDIHFLSCLSGLLINGYNPHIIMCCKENPLMRLCYYDYIEFYLIKKTYTYWKWSIVYIFNYNIKQLFKNKTPTKEGIYYLEGKKYQFIKEIANYINNKNDHCVYNGIKVLNNRYSNYIDHKFV